MKKAVYILACLLLSFSTYAQSDKSNKDFENYSEQQMTIVGKAFQNKNYTQVLTALQDWEKRYTALPADVQKEYAYGAGNAIYYNLACAYSLNKQANKAIESLKKAIELGYDNRAHIDEDSDLDFIRKNKQFIKLVDSMPKKESYIEILQKAGKYVSADTTGLPPFNYEPVTNFRIKSVKEYFKLDSIAGKGDEISQIINLLNWVHNTIRHDGSHRPNCSEFDAMDLYNYHKTTGRGINCRMLAIVLNECYLSMGFKSRFMTCLPKDENDQDCHVINCVYSKTLNKWIWMDPTFNAYLKDENGTLLSIEEVRTRLIENKPIVLNEDANWNNENKQTKKYYVDHYMAKNLYWLQCPANSYFNVESPYRNTNVTYISLTPEGFDRFNKSGRSKGQVMTHDPAYFWQAPMEK